jgi:hypothetical protein
MAYLKQQHTSHAESKNQWSAGMIEAGRAAIGCGGSYSDAVAAVRHVAHDSGLTCDTGWDAVKAILRANGVIIPEAKITEGAFVVAAGVNYASVLNDGR